MALFKKYYDKPTGETYRNEDITAQRRTTLGRLLGAKPTEIEIQEKKERDEEKEVTELLKTKTPVDLRKELDEEHNRLHRKVYSSSADKDTQTAYSKNLSLIVALGRVMEKNGTPDFNADYDAIYLKRRRGGRRKTKASRKPRRITRRR